MTKKVTRAICGPDEKKLKKYWKVGIELSINDNTKSTQIYTLPSVSDHVRKNYLDLTHIIYWPTKIA